MARRQPGERPPENPHFKEADPTHLFEVIPSSGTRWRMGSAELKKFCASCG